MKHIADRVIYLKAKEAQLQRLSLWKRKPGSIRLKRLMAYKKKLEDLQP